MSATPAETVAISVASSVTASVTAALFLDLFIKPKVERRNLRRRVAYESRDRVSENMLIILSAGTRLRESADFSATVHDLLRTDRERWYAQIEEATRHLIDNLHVYLMTYHGAFGLRDLLNRYANNARGVVLSGRSMARKGELLVQMTEPAWGLYFGSSPWNPRSISRAPGHRKALEEALDHVEGESD